MNLLNKILSKIDLHQKAWKVPAIRMNSNTTDFDEALKNFDDIMINVAISNEGNNTLMTIWDENYEYSFELNDQILKYINKKK